MSVSKTYPRVLVLGMDGLDPQLLAAMIEDNQLPAFARLRQQGTLCALATSNPAESPVAWSSLATGCNPGRHGIFDFIHRKPAGYVPFLSLTRERSGAAFGRNANRFVSPREQPGFWQMTSEAGRPSTVVRWPVTFPAETVKGNFLSGLGTPDATGRLGKHNLYTTDDEGSDDDKVIRVKWSGNKIATSVFGPMMTGLGGMRPVRTAMSIERRDDGVAVKVGSQHTTVAIGQWSDWVHVQFKCGPVRIADGLVKFHLVGIEPHLRLFATPVQIDPCRQVWPITQPAAYGQELADRLGPFYTLGLAEDTHAVTEGRYDLDPFLHQCAEITRERRAMFEHELNRFDEGVLAFVFDASDRIQHLFWSIDDQESPTYEPALAEKYAHVVPDHYREMDSTVSAALDAGGDDMAVFVVSDHGFGPFHRAVHVNRWLVDNGYMTLKNSGEGGSLFADVDWTRTKAYSLGFTSIYLNVSGRESEGAVKPGSEAEELTREIAARLRDTQDPVFRKPMVRAVYDARTIYNGPHTGEGPDLVIGFEPGYRSSWQTALGGAPQEVVVDNDKRWAADHLVDPSAVPGVLATNVAIAGENAQGIDLAPTVLACLDVPIPTHIEGTPLLADAPSTPTKVDASTPTEPECVGATAATPEGDGLNDEERAELESRLSDLGYL